MLAERCRWTTAAFLGQSSTLVTKMKNNFNVPFIVIFGLFLTSCGNTQQPPQASAEVAASSIHSSGAWEFVSSSVTLPDTVLIWSSTPVSADRSIPRPATHSANSTLDLPSLRSVSGSSMQVPSLRTPGSLPPEISTTKDRCDTRSSLTSAAYPGSR